tara:strand:+ start:7217 stop:8230 length:1014 start_codon:yes stop_codon:yes gene_type:complete
MINKGHMNNTAHPVDIESRFREPEGWRWHHFERNGRSLRFGSVSPKDHIPDAVIVCLQGVREFSEKYFEIAHWCLEHNLAFWMCDWAGQGKSSRFLTNPQKRHSHGFDDDVEDLQYFILQYIKHASVHPDKGRIPLAMLAHSMGAHIGLRHLDQYPGTFECAALTAPMIGLKVFENTPPTIALAAASVCKLLCGSSYIPKGNDWSKRNDDASLTSDPVRSKIHDLWCDADAALRCGDVTYRWVCEAQRSCLKLKKAIEKKTIETPCLFGIPGQEHLVDNPLAQKVIGNIAHARVVHYPHSHHEVLMETDDIRNNFLDHFYDLIKETIIDRPETLKPF